MAIAFDPRIAGLVGTTAEALVQRKSQADPERVLQRPISDAKQLSAETHRPLAGGAALSDAGKRFSS